MIFSRQEEAGGEGVGTEPTVSWVLGSALLPGVPAEQPGLPSVPRRRSQLTAA